MLELCSTDMRGGLRRCRLHHPKAAAGAHELEVGKDNIHHDIEALAIFAQHGAL